MGGCGRAALGGHGGSEEAEGEAEPDDEDVTTESTLTLQQADNGVATAIEETSWGRIKDAFGE